MDCGLLKQRTYDLLRDIYESQVDYCTIDKTTRTLVNNIVQCGPISYYTMVRGCFVNNLLQL